MAPGGTSRLNVQGGDLSAGESYSFRERSMAIWRSCSPSRTLFRHSPLHLPVVSLDGIFFIFPSTIPNIVQVQTAPTKLRSLPVNNTRPHWVNCSTDQCNDHRDQRRNSSCVHSPLELGLPLPILYPLWIRYYRSFQTSRVR